MAELILQVDHSALTDLTGGLDDLGLRYEFGVYREVASPATPPDRRAQHEFYSLPPDAVYVLITSAVAGMSTAIAKIAVALIRARHVSLTLVDAEGRTISIDGSLSEDEIAKLIERARHNPAA